MNRISQKPWDSAILTARQPLAPQTLKLPMQIGANWFRACVGLRLPSLPPKVVAWSASVELRCPWSAMFLQLELRARALCTAQGLDASRALRPPPRAYQRGRTSIQNWTHILQIPIQVTKAAFHYTTITILACLCLCLLAKEAAAHVGLGPLTKMLVCGCNDTKPPTLLAGHYSGTQKCDCLGGQERSEQICRPVTAIKKLSTAPTASFGE